MARQNISSGSPWEDVVGYCRAVRVGEHVFVAGTTGTDALGKVLAPDAYGQAKAALARIEVALGEAGCSLSDVVRTRMYVTDMSLASEVTRAHGEAFLKIKPAATLLGVASLIAPEILVEIEADALAGSALVTEVTVRDIEASKAFYLSLGFAMQRDSGAFVVLTWDGFELFLDERADFVPPAFPAGNVRVMVPDVDRVWGLCQSLGVPVHSEIGDRYYGLRDFTVLDPDGFGVRFATRL